MTQLEIDKDLICSRIKNCQSYELLYSLLTEFVKISSKQIRKCEFYDEDCFPYGDNCCKRFHKIVSCKGDLTKCIVEILYDR